jgi:serine/threonine-protein kinase RsbW
MDRSRLCIAAKLNNLREIRRFIQETATALGVDAAMIPDIVLAVDEAASNIVFHGYQVREGVIQIEVERRGNALVVRLRDEATPFDPTSVPPPDLSLPLEQRPLGGMGIHLMRQVMDEVIHRITPQGGNELTLVKRGLRANDSDLVIV